MHLELHRSWAIFLLLLDLIALSDQFVVVGGRWTRLAVVFASRCPFSLIPERGPLRDGERWDAMTGEGSTVLYTSAKERLLFLLFVRGRINSVHIIRFWQGEALSADIEKRQERFTSPVFPSHFVYVFYNNIRLYYLGHPFTSIIFGALFFSCPEKVGKWSASLTSWHHMSVLVLGDRDLLFSHALW